MRPEGSSSEAQAHGAVFATTHWSVVLAAAERDTPQAVAALEELCRTYWYPLYAYVRRQGHSPEDAQDLAQDFFAKLMANGFPRGATPERGKFRSFLLASLRHFLVDQHRHAGAVKRGGGKSFISLDQNQAEQRLDLACAHTLTPDRLYDREWAMALLDRAQCRLEEEYATAGRAELYSRLRNFPVATKGDRSFDQVAADLGMTVSALKSAVHRMRARYRELVREEVAHTVLDPAEVREEARYLIEILSD
jgi:RNA polymerase sigma-70 factor (ECF subfamily)